MSKPCISVDQFPPSILQVSETVRSTSTVRLNGGPAMTRRFTVSSDDSGGEHVDCGGRSCRSCTAVVIADCVALSCCPCAVVNILALALVKAPYVVGRRCLGMLRRRRGFLQKRRIRDVAEKCDGDGDGEIEKEKVVVRVHAKPLERRRGDEWGEMGVLGIALGENKHDRGIFGIGLEESRSDRGILGVEMDGNAHDRLGSRADHEGVWVEFYQIGHWGFGRVSFSTNPGRGSSGREGRSD